MINYELAKKLKDAGFPQGWGPFTFFYETKNSSLDNLWAQPWAIVQKKHGGYVDSLVKCPTLPELIDACGDGFGWLSRRKDTNDWVAAKGFLDLSTMCVGETSEEAVVNLYLKLNT